MHEHLERAKEYLAIAESGDARKEAYMAAAEEIAAYKDATGDSNSKIAGALQQPTKRIASLLRWRGGGYDEPTPWRREGKDEGAALSHAKRVLADDPEKVIENLTDEGVEKVAKAVENQRVARKLYPDRIKPTIKQASTSARRDQTERLKENPREAVARVGAALAQGAAITRGIVQEYQDFLALIEDEEWREYVRERLVNYRAEVDLALGEALSGSMDEALARLLKEEEEVNK